MSPESRTGEALYHLYNCHAVWCIGNLDPSSSPGRDLPPFEDEADNMDDAAEEEEGEELFGENLERCVYKLYG